MRRAISIALTLGASAALTACATGPEPAPTFTARQQANLDDMLKGKVAGKPVTCVPVSTSSSRGLTAINDDVLVYKASSRLVYRNDLRGKCSGLAFGDTLVLNVRGGQYCKGDIARVVDLTSGIERGSCSLGEFTPYTAPTS